MYLWIGLLTLYAITPLRLGRAAPPQVVSPIHGCPRPGLNVVPRMAPLATDSATFCKLPHWLLFRSDLTMSAKVIWAYLSDRQGSNGHCWPGQRRIAMDLGTDHKVVIRGIAELEAVGLLSVTRPSLGRKNQYRIAIGTESPPVPNRHQKRSRIATGSDGESPTKPDPVTRPNKPDPINGRSAPVKSNGAALACEIPASLNVPQFQELWMEWNAERKAKRKSLTPGAARRQLKFLEGLGLEAAMASINQSIEKGWVGLFAVKTDGRSVALPATKPLTDDDFERIKKDAEKLREVFGDE